jgi:hypothetical protein
MRDLPKKSLVWRASRLAAAGAATVGLSAVVAAAALGAAAPTGAGNASHPLVPRPPSQPARAASSQHLVRSVASGRRFERRLAAVSAPMHRYSIEGWDFGQLGTYIIATPSQIEAQSGVGIGDTLLGSGGILYGTDQYIYYRLWAYSYKEQQWHHSGWERVCDRFQFGHTEVWNSNFNAWMVPASNLPSLGLVDGPDYSSAIAPEQVAVPTVRGSGWWYFTMETYWTPPYNNTTTPSIFDPSIPAGGLRVYDPSGFQYFY